MIAFLWAEAANHVIGVDGHLPWHLPDDLHYFRAQTVNQIMVMGRKTYEGLPKRPLPDRLNVVVTHDANYSAPGVQVATSKQAVLKIAQDHPDKRLVIVGGAKIFELFADVVDTLLVTRIAGDFAGDTQMPAIDWADFTRVSAREVTTDDPALNHTFEKWERKA